MSYIELQFASKQTQIIFFWIEYAVFPPPPIFYQIESRPCVEDNNLFIELDIYNLQNSVNSRIDIGYFHLIHPCIVSS